VLGFLLDCDTKVMRVSINGTWMPRTCFEDFQFTGGLTPAVSASGTKVLAQGQMPQHFRFQFNFGHRPFENDAMPTGYKSIHQWMLAEQARVRVLTGAAGVAGVASGTGRSGAGEEKAGTETVGYGEKTAKWVIDRLKESAKASMVAELLGIEGDPELKASLLASELGLI
jgi:hypothetical protein